MLVRHWNTILVISFVVEVVIFLEDLFVKPDLTVCVEHLTIHVVGNSSTVLDLAGNVLNCQPVILLDSVREVVVHVLLDEQEGRLQVTIVELVWHSESKGTELSALKHNGVHEADGEDNTLPFVQRLDLFKEVSVDLGVERARQTILESLWRHERVLYGHLKETKREVDVVLTSDPKSKVLMRLDIGRIKQGFHFCHQLKTKLTVA